MGEPGVICWDNQGKQGRQEGYCSLTLPLLIGVGFYKDFAL